MKSKKTPLYRKHIELTSEQINLIKYYKKKEDLKIIFSALDVKSYIDLKTYLYLQTRVDRDKEVLIQLHILF